MKTMEAYAPTKLVKLSGEDESMHVDEITVQKLEALVEEYKQKDATNKHKLEEMQDRIDEMEGEIDQHMEASAEKHYCVKWVIARDVVKLGVFDKLELQKYD